jgi:serine/alanine adding enzyme
MYEYERLLYLTDDDEQAITFFLQRCEGFHYFQSPEFFKVCLASRRQEPYYIVARQQSKLVGVMLVYRQLQIGLPGVGFLTSRNLIIGGPVVEANQPEIVQGLLKAYKTNALNSLYTQVRNLRDVSLFREFFEQQGFHYDDHLDILVDLTCSEEALWKGIHTKRRNEIRRSEKEGCSVVLTSMPQSLTECYNILTEVYQRARMPLPDYSHFDAILRQTTEHTGLRLFTAMWEGKIIGCMLCLAYGDILYDYYAGSYSRFYAKYPNDLLPWAVFKWAKQNGFLRFDFGGAGKPNVAYGVREYKKKFGGTLVNYGRYEAVHYPILFGLATKLFALWKSIKR